MSVSFVFPSLSHAEEKTNAILDTPSEAAGVEDAETKRKFRRPVRAHVPNFHLPP